jgi:hypothetical protein
MALFCQKCHTTLSSPNFSKSLNVKKDSNTNPQFFIIVFGNKLIFHLKKRIQQKVMYLTVKNINNVSFFPFKVVQKILEHHKLN